MSKLTGVAICYHRRHPPDGTTPVPMKIAIINFWNTAFEGDFIGYFLNRVTDGQHRLVASPDEADVVFSSVFGNTPSRADKTIFFIGENMRPNYFGCRFSLSFDLDSWGGRNCYLPWWYSVLAWPGFSYRRVEGRLDFHGHEEPIPIERLTQRREPPAGLAERKFCAFVASNPEGLRSNLYGFIHAYKPVDGFGKIFGQPMLRSKFSLLPQYRFNLCPENSFFPGYVTEKLFEAWAGGTLPIYYGALPPGGLINRKAFLNYADYFDIGRFVARIAELENNPDEYARLYSEPLLTAAPRLEPAIEFTRNAIETILSGR